MIIEISELAVFDNSLSKITFVKFKNAISRYRVSFERHVIILCYFVCCPIFLIIVFSFPTTNSLLHLHINLASLGNFILHHLNFILLLIHLIYVSILSHFNWNCDFFIHVLAFSFPVFYIVNSISDSTTGQKYYVSAFLFSSYCRYCALKTKIR